MGSADRPSSARRSLRLRAPAKLNFGLRIVGRRADGYHEIESVFVPLDLADEVELEVAPGGRPGIALRLEGAGPDVPADARNLAARAASRFAEAAGLAGGIRVVLRKRIPAAAGLGGGSSDAGAVLRGLSQLCPGALDGSALAALALELGADVPFFLDPRPARVSGIGERLEPLPDWPALAVALLSPGVALSTERVYAAYDALAGPAPAGPAPTGLRGAPSEERARAGSLRNDLEPAAVRLCPPIARLRRRLCDQGATAVGLSGSGPTLFGVFEGPGAAAAALARAAPGPPGWARVASTVHSG